LQLELTDLGSAVRIIELTQIEEIYNLAAQSFVAASFEQPYSTSEVNAFGPLNLLEAIRITNTKIKFYQAGTSEMFGKVAEIPQNEKTIFYPRSPYGVSKLYAHWITINYRESYNIFGVSGILFNHESPLRGVEFVTRKITESVAKISIGLLEFIELGNLNAKRDWGYAEEYVEGMWKMMQEEDSDTYILATNRTKTVRDFVTMAFKAVGIDIVYSGKDENEIGYDANTGKKLIVINPIYYRPAEVDVLVGDYSKAKRVLGWEPKTTLEELCKLMVEADIQRLKK
jgi:GDPmannose 4,6-dehydratase